MTIKTMSLWKFFVLISMFTLFLSACSDDDNPSPDPDPTDSIPDDNDSIPDDNDSIPDDTDPDDIPEAIMSFGEGDNSGAEIFGADTVEGRNGTDSYVFNATDDTTECGHPGGDYVKLGKIGAIWEDGFTVVSWVKFEENRLYERIIDLGNGRGDDGGLNVTFARYETSNSLVLTSWINDNPDINKTTGRLIAEDAIVNGEMHFYAATISPEGEMKIYVDGQLVAEKADGHPVENVERSENYIGRSNWCEEDPDFKGEIDDVKLYPAVLSAEQIAALYNE